MKKSLIFFHGMIATLSYFSENLAAWAADTGLDCLMLDAHGNQENNRNTIADHARKYQCTVILFNSIMLEHLPTQEEIGRELHLTVINILVDHPITYPGALTFPLKNYHIVVVDRDHLHFIQTYYPDVKYCHFMPLGGIEEENRLSYNKRDLDILYVANCQEEPTFIEIPEFPDGGRSFYETVCGLLIEKTTLSTEMAIWMWMAQSGVHLTSKEFVFLYFKYGYRCELMVKRLFKQEIMKVLSESGLHVEVYGKGWENTSYQYAENIRFHDPVSPRECGLLSCRAKICLNIMPWFKDGSHDRIHTAMLNGAVSVTDTSKYLEERFTHEKELIFFDLKNIPELIENLRKILEDPAYARSIARSGFSVARENDTWKQRLSFLLSISQ